MKRILLCFWFFLLCTLLSAQSPLPIKDSADKLMSTDMKKAVDVYKLFLKKASADEKRWYFFMYEAYDSINIASLLNDDPLEAEKAVQQAFELARRLNDEAVLDRLTLVNLFYKTTLSYNMPLTNRTNGTPRELILPVLSVKQLRNDTVEIKFAGGIPEGIKKGSPIEVMGIKQPFLSADRSSNLLGQGIVTSVSNGSSTARIIQTYTSDSTDNIYKGDMVMLEAAPYYRSGLGAYQFLSDYAISFQDNYRSDAYSQRQLLFYPIKDQEKLLDSFFMKAVSEVAEMLKDDTVGQFGIKIDNGLFKGIFMTQALAKTKVEHIRSFLKYVKTYPGKYYGMKYKFSEVYATWLINSSPLSEGGLMELLVEYRGKPYFNELLQSYDSAIVKGRNWIYWKNAFLDSLDKGVFKAGDYEILKTTVAYYKQPEFNRWQKVLDARVLAYRSKRQEAIAKLQEAQKDFEAAKLPDDAAFVKNQVLQVSNQRVAKVAVQTSHFLPYAVTFSPNGKFFATYGDDYTLKIWDAKLMRQIVTLAAHSNSINQVTFSANNRYFVSASDDETIKIWDLGSLQLYKTITAGYRVKYATLNKLGDKIIAAGADSCIKIFDFLTGKVDSTYRIHKAKINTGAYNPDYQNIFYSGGSDSLVYSTNIAEGEWTRWYKSGGRVASVKVTEDRKYLAVLGDNGQIKTWRTNGKFNASFPSQKFKYGSSTTTTLSGFDISSRNHMIAFADSNNMLCLGSLDSMSYYPYDMKLKSKILDLAFHPSGNSIIVSTIMDSMYVVNLRGFNMKATDSIQWATVGSKSGMISTMGFSDDGDMFAFQSGSTYVLNLATGKTTQWGEESFGQLRGKINFTRNDSSLFFVPLDSKRIIEQDLVSGDTTFQLSTDPYYIAYQDLSPDKKLWIANFHKKAFVIYDLQQKKLLHTIPLDSSLNPITQMAAAMFIPGSDKVVVQSDVNNSISFYKMDQPFLKPFKRYTSKLEQAFYAMVYNPQTNEVIAGCQDNNLYFFNAETGELRDTINFNYYDANEGISVLKLFPDNKRLFVAMNTRMFVYDLTTKKIVSDFDNESYILTNAEISPQGDLVAIGTFTGNIHFYETKTFKKVMEVQTFMKKDPVWMTPDNYYIASKQSLKELDFKYNNTLYPFDQFDINFNRPDKVLEKLGRVDPALLKAYAEAWNKRFKKSGIPASRLRPDFKVPEVLIVNEDSISPMLTRSPLLNLVMQFSDMDTTIASYNIWVNGIPEYGTRGRQFRKRQKQLTVRDTVKLNTGVNVIQVACKNSNGVESLKEKFEVRNMVPDNTKRNTYLFVVSVSKYKDSRYDLQYARKDGRDLVKLFESRFDNVIVDTLFDEKAVLKNIMAWKEKMKRTETKDRVIVYVSGHGVLDKNFDFYYATQNIDFKNPQVNGLAYESIEKLLDSIPARYKLLLMDACHSGEVDKDDVVASTAAIKKTDASVQVVYKSKGVGEEDNNRPKLGLNNSFQLMQDLFANLNSGNGTVVISAAAGNSYAYESEEWKNGVFTYSILHGLKDRAADENGDGRVSVSELQKYVSAQVQKLTKGAQKPTARQENLENDWFVW